MAGSNTVGVGTGVEMGVACTGVGMSGACTGVATGAGLETGRRLFNSFMVTFKSLIALVSLHTFSFSSWQLQKLHFFGFLWYGLDSVDEGNFKICCASSLSGGLVFPCWNPNPGSRTDHIMNVLPVTKNNHLHV